MSHGKYGGKRPLGTVAVENPSVGESPSVGEMPSLAA